MIGHIGLNVPDPRAAQDYYKTVLPFLGFEPFFST